jgi:aminodeoxychorismate lyase
VPDDAAVISVFDRGFSLGDALFEALPVQNGKPIFWQKHFERLQAGAKFLEFEMPFTTHELRKFADELFAKNQMNDCMLRLQLSRGIGARGYSIKNVKSPTFVMSLHPPANLSLSCSLVTSSVRISTNDPLTQFKTCSKLSRVAARIQSDRANADDALLVNTNGDVAETTSANIFWIERETVCTPPLSSGALAGVTRGVILERCKQLNIRCEEKDISAEALLKTNGVFLTSSSVGIREVRKLDGNDLPRAALTQTLRDDYLKHVDSSH